MKANSRPRSASRKSAGRSKTPPASRVEIGGIFEPDWSRLLPDTGERAAASEHWRRVAGDMHGAEILAPSNGHALQRLVLTYLNYDRASLAVAVDGMVTVKNPDNPKAIDRLSVHYNAMREAENTADRLEAHLGLTPGKRGKVGKVSRPKERGTGADAFLRPRAQ